MVLLPTVMIIGNYVLINWGQKLKRYIDKKFQLILNRLMSQSSYKPLTMSMALLPLAACGGGGNGGGNNPTAPAPAPPPEPDPDFTESPINVFVALDNLDRTLSEGGNAANLTVTGKNGNDSITTGSGDDIVSGSGGNDTIITNGGNDLIRAGEGRDTISAGTGDDGIVIVGTTAADQYTNGAITNSGGSGMDLSSLITLADLNGRGVSEVVSGEVIDGGAGVNTLYVYGTVDLTGVTLNNVTVLVVNSDVTLTPEQIASFTTVDGDGNSLITIEIPEGSPDNYILDLSALDLTDVQSIHIDGDIRVMIDDASDLDGVGTITNGASDALTLEVTGAGSNTNVNLGEIADTFTEVDAIEIAEDVTLEVDDANDITTLGLQEISGNGDVENGGDADVLEALDDIEIDENIVVELPSLSISDVISNEADESAIFTVTLSEPWGQTVTVDFSAPDGSSGTLTFAPGETQKAFPTAWNDDALDETDEVVSATLSNPTNATVADGSGELTIQDDDDPLIAVDDTASVSENGFVLIDVLSNDLFGEGNLEITSVEIMSDGWATYTIIDNEVRFEPGDFWDYLDDGESIDVQIIYEVSDDDETDTGQIDITINGVSDTLQAVDDTASVDEDGTVLMDVLANDLFAEGNMAITDVFLASEELGVLTIVDNKIQFEPSDFFDFLNDGAGIPFSFTYEVSDDNESDWAEVVVTVNGVTDSTLQTIGDSASVVEDGVVLIDVLANDFYGQGDLEITNVGYVSEEYGVLTIVDNKIQFDPGGDFDFLEDGESTYAYITYTAADDNGSDTAVVAITVNGVTHNLTAVDDSASVSENGILLVDVLANDLYADGDMEITNLGYATDDWGDITIVNDQIQFEPGEYFDYLSDGESIDIQITYEVTDDSETDLGELTITVNGVSNNPSPMDRPPLSDASHSSNGENLLVNEDIPLAIA